MLLAELEIRHSRPVAPTRRVALGFRMLPTDPAPGWGAVLLCGLIVASMPSLEVDDLVPIYDLIDDLESGRQMPQPQLRHRFQKDTVGLDSSRYSLIGEGEHVWFDFEDHARPEVNVLGALYAAGELDVLERPPVFRALRKAVVWERPLGDDFVAHVLGDDAVFSRWRALPNDTRWALRLLGFGPEDGPDRNEVNARFRDLVREAHPDSGGDESEAARRITELTQARRILLV